MAHNGQEGGTEALLALLSKGANIRVLSADKMVIEGVVTSDTKLRGKGLELIKEDKPHQLPESGSFISIKEILPATWKGNRWIEARQPAEHSTVLELTYAMKKDPTFPAGTLYVEVKQN
jgi:hypothetical protein